MSAYRAMKLLTHLLKQACATPSLPLSPTISRAKRDIISRYKASVSLYWSQNAPERYQKLGINANIGSSPELKSLNRYALGRLLAARSGHGDFADYHCRFQHSDALLICACGLEKSPEHFFRRLNRSRSRLCSGNKHPTTGIRWILGSPEGAIAFSKWLHETSFFEACNNKTN